MPCLPTGPLLLVALLLAASAGEWGRGRAERDCPPCPRRPWPTFFCSPLPSPSLSLTGTAAAAKPRLTTTPDGHIVNEKGDTQHFYGVNWFGFNTE